MKVTLSYSNPSELETECLAVVVVDQGEKDKPAPKLLGGNQAISSAAADLLSSGEVSGKMLETVMIHRPQGLKARRLLLVGGGKAKEFSAFELRKLAGAAIRYVKPKQIHSLAFLLPEMTSGAADALKAAVEGAFVGDFDPDTYKSDRKDQQIDELTLLLPASADPRAMEKALAEGASSANRRTSPATLVNEPGNS